MWLIIKINQESHLRKPIVFRDFVNQRQFGAFLFYLFHDKAK